MHQRILLLLFVIAPCAWANVVGSDAQNFNPTTSGLDFVTVQSSETLEPGVFNLGLFANYAKNPLPVRKSVSEGGGKRGSSLTGGDLNLGLGLMRGWDVGVSLPFILQQEVEDTASTGHYSATGNTEVRVNTKFRLWGNDQGGLALITSANFNRIANNPYLGKDGGPILNVEVASDTTLGPMALALNLGYRARNAGQAIAGSGVDPLANQWLASGALSYHMDDLNSKLIWEVLAAMPSEDASENSTDREYTVLESLLGVKYDGSSNFSVHVGAGASLMKGISSPDFRVYTGLNLSFGRTRKPTSHEDPYAKKRRRRVVRVAKTKKVEDESAERELAPAVSTETIRTVKVINRGAFKHIVLNNLEFVGSSLRFTPESEGYLGDGLVPAIRELNTRRPIDRIVVEGYTDSINNSARNKLVSEKRAEVVVNLLRQNLGLNIPLTAVGFGETNPIGDNGNYQGRALNNRVEIKLIYRRASSP